jgi:hypothetical protein
MDAETGPLRILSLGAGVQSSTLALMIAHGELPMVDAAIFADTGAEPKGVYDWLDWLETKLPFPVHRAQHGNLETDILGSIRNADSRVGQAPFYIKSEGDAREGMLWRKCTKEYKLAPLRKKTRELMEAAGVKSVQCVIGISWDEATRMRASDVKYIQNEYPLVDRQITRIDCLRWMTKNGYPMPAKSACYFCPYTDDSRWREMKINDPASFALAARFDSAIRSGLPGVKGQAFLHRSLKPLEEVDFRNAEDFGQIDAFGNECEGMCGV